MNGILYLVGTPIGNMGDITLRAIEILNTVDYIACEDTRHSMTLLNKYGIKKPTISYYLHKERESGEKILKLLADGKNVALITDAGMPCISDPGSTLVEMARNDGYVVNVVPGPSAVVSAMALTGITRRGFCFLGFLPEKNKDRLSLLSPYIHIDIQLVFYCSPHDINEDLELFYNVLGDRKVFVIKELTKMFEGVEIGQLSTLRVENPRGEYVVVIEGQDQESELIGLSIKDHLMHYIEQGMDKKDAVKLTAKERGVPKDEVYKVALDLD